MSKKESHESDGSSPLEIGLDSKAAKADALEAAIEACGHPVEGLERTIAERARVQVGPFGQTLPGDVSSLLRVVEDFGYADGSMPVTFEDTPEVPSSSISVRNAKAEELANTSSLFPANWHPVLKLIYEFNCLTGEQIEIITGIGKTGVSKRMNLWLKNGVVRGMKIGRRRVWFLTDLGARTGRHILSRSGPLIPFEPGKGEGGLFEATRKWAPRNNPNPRPVIHDLHVASYVLQLATLCDGGIQKYEDPDESIIASLRGEFSSFIRPPLRVGRRGHREPIDLHAALQVQREVGFTGINSDSPRFGSLSPDAIIELRNLARDQVDPRAGQLEVWIELDRQGNHSKLREKLNRFDRFLGIWWRFVPRYLEAGKPPLVIFVAPDIEVLRKMLKIADETLKVSTGPKRLGPATWGPPISRSRIHFALESDLHMGSLRMYRVPEKTPRERQRDASDQRGRTEVANIQPRMRDLLPPWVLADK